MGQLSAKSGLFQGGKRIASGTGCRLILASEGRRHHTGGRTFHWFNFVLVAGGADQIKRRDRKRFARRHFPRRGCGRGWALSGPRFMCPKDRRRQPGNCGMLTGKNPS